MLFTVNIPEIKANNYIFDAYVSRAYHKYQATIDNYHQAYKVSVNKFDPAVLLSSSLNEMIAENTEEVTADRQIEDLKTAVNWMDKAIESDPKNMFYYYLQAKNYSLLAELTSEVKYIEKGLDFANLAKELSPGRVRPNWILGQLYLFGSQPEKALVYLNEAKNMNANVPETYYYLSVVYRQLQDEQKAMEQFDKLIDLNFNFYNEDQVSLLLPIYESRNDTRRIIYLLTEMTRFQPKDPNSWMNLIDALEADQQYQLALNYLKHAASVIPSLSTRAYGRYLDISKKLEAQAESIN